MRIAFYFAATWAWSAQDLEDHGVGGTETAMGNMARAFARQGHEVVVFHQAERPCVRRGVSFRHVATLAYGDTWDAFVSLSRVPRLEEVRAAVKIHWCLEHGELWVGDWWAVFPAVDAVFTLSPYHTALLVRKYGLPAARLYTTRCAIDPEEYGGTPALAKVPGQLLYCSVPDRGLHRLPAIYRLARALVPHLSLVITSDFSLWGLQAALDDTKAPAAASASAWVSAVPARFAGSPGVQLLGRVPRPRLIELQRQSQLHVYPSTFQELFCLASLECQAAGTPSLTTDLGALPTTVVHGRTGEIVPLGGGPRPDFERQFVDGFTPATERAFAARIAALLGDPARLAFLSRQARERALKSFSADVVAREWLAEFARVAGRRAIG